MSEKSQKVLADYTKALELGQIWQKVLKLIAFQLYYIAFQWQPTTRI